MHLRGNQLAKASFIVTIAVCCLAGCGGSLFSYKGVKVTQADLRIQLQDGGHQGVWKTNEIEIKYQYQMISETLKLAGTIEMIDGNRSFSHLSVYLLFLDAQGIVIENTLVYSGGNYRRIVTIPMDFENTVPIPEGARTISFAYDLSAAHGK